MSKDNLIKVWEECKKHSSDCHESDVTDQTGETGHTYQCKINEVAIILGECNDYHYDHDFEIGISTATEQEFNDFTDSINKTFYEIGSDENGTKYAIPGDDKTHGPFYFMYDKGKTCNTDCLKAINIRVSEYDMFFYQKYIEPFMPEKLKALFYIETGSKFKLKSIAFKDFTLSI